ncbi:MAG: flagellar biosynthetic protein FliR [Deltaproteobacteria bacterium]|nr:flagellar biosynthetic protein FliR [Deltaproteobacteria bacterium]
MTQLPFTLVQLETFLMVFVRSSAILLAVPLFGSSYIATISKVGLSLSIAWALFPSVAVPPELASVKLVQLVPALITEVLLGVTIGFTARLFFEGIQLGGQLAGFQMGFGIVNVIDPFTGANFSVIAQVQNLLATLLFIVLNMHHWFFKAVAQSFEVIPLFQCNMTEPLMQWIVEMSSNMFIIAVKVAAPLMATLLFTTTALGIIAKLVQGINIFIVAFPVKIAIGLVVLGLSMPMFALIVQKIFSPMGEYLYTIIRFGSVA